MKMSIKEIAKFSTKSLKEVNKIEDQTEREIKFHQLSKELLQLMDVKVKSREELIKVMKPVNTYFYDRKKEDIRNFVNTAFLELIFSDTLK